jgi:hypothetical protein
VKVGWAEEEGGRGRGAVSVEDECFGDVGVDFDGLHDKA